MAATQTQSDCQPQLLSSSNNLNDKELSSPSFTNGNDDSSRGSSSNDGFPTQKTATPPGSTPNSPLVSPMICQRPPFSPAPGYPVPQQHGMPVQHHNMVPGYGGPMMPGQYPMSRGGGVPPTRPPVNQVYHPGQPFPPSPHGYGHQHHTTAGTWEPPAPSSAPYPGPLATGVQPSPAIPASAASQECNVSEVGGSGEAASASSGTNGQATARPPPSPSASSTGLRSMSPAVAAPNIPPMPPRPATSHADPSGAPRVPQPHSVYPQPGAAPVPHKMPAATAGGYPLSQGGMHPSYPAMYTRPPHYPGQYQPAPGYTATPAAGPQAPPSHLGANWPAAKQPGMYPAPPRSPQYMRHQLQPAPQKPGVPSNGVAPPTMAPPPSSTPQPSRPASQSSDAASVESTVPPAGPVYPLLPPIGPDGVPLDDASQHSTLSNTSITSEDRSRSPKPRKDISGNSSSLPPTPVAGVALSPGGQQQQQQPTPPQHQLSEDSEHTNMSNSPTTSWPRSPVSVFNPSTPRENYHIVKKADSLNRLYDIDDNPMRRDFLNRLLTFMEERGTPILQCPTVSKQPLDLFRLYHHTKERGGFVEVMKNKAWKDVAIAMGIGGSSSGAYTLRKHYMKNLIFYECQFDRGGIDPAPILSKYETKSAKKKNAPSPGPQDSFSNSGSMDGFPAGYGANYGASVSSGASAAGAEYNSSNSNSSNGPNQPTPGYPPHGYPGAQSGYGHYPNASGAEYPPVQGQAPPPGHYMHQYPGRGPYHHPQQQTQPSQPPTVDYRYGSGPASGPYGAPVPRPPAAGAPAPTASVTASAGDSQGQSPAVTSATSQFQMPSSSVNFSSQLAKQLSAPLPSRANVQTSPSKHQPASAFMPAPTLAKQLAAPSFSQLRNNATFSNTGAVSAPGPAASNTSSASTVSYGSPCTPSSAPSRRPDAVPGATSPSLAPPAAGAPSTHHAAPVSYAQTPPYGWRGYHPSQQYGSASPWAHSNSPAAPRFPAPAPYPPPPQQQPATGPAWPQAQSQSGLAPSPRQAAPLRPPVAGKDRPLPPGVVKPVGGIPVSAASAVASRSAAVTFPADSVEAVPPLLVKRRRLVRADLCPVDGWRLVMSLRSGQLAESRAALDQLLVLSHDDAAVTWLALGHMPGLLPALLQHWRHALAAVLGADAALHEQPGDAARLPASASMAAADGKVETSLGLGVCQPFDPADKCTLLAGADYTLSTRQNRPVMVQDRQDAILVAEQPQPWCEDAADAADWTHLVSPARVESGRVPIIRRLRDGRLIAADNSSTCQGRPTAESPPPPSLPNFDTDLEFFLSRLRPELPLPSPSSVLADSAGVAVKQEPESTESQEEDVIGERVRDPAGVLRRRRADEQLEDECCRREQTALTLIGDTQLAAIRRCVALTTLLRNLSFVPGNEQELAVEPVLAPLAELVLLRHRHPPRSARHHNYDRDEDADFALANPAAAPTDDCWWVEYVPLLHEHALVTLSNLCGHVRLAEHAEALVWPLLDGLLHWLVCSSSYAGDPLPPPCGTAGSAGLSPRRLALECVCRLCVCGDNVDLLLATPPLHRLQRLCQLAAGWLAAAGDDQVLRELTLSLVYYLSDADERVARWLAVEPGFVGALVRFVETAEHNALTVANTQGVHALRDNPELMGTSLDMLGRAAGTLLHLARVEENRQLLAASEERLLQLVMSQILDQRVAGTLAHVLHRVARAASPPLPSAPAACSLQSS